MGFDQSLISDNRKGLALGWINHDRNSNKLNGRGNRNLIFKNNKRALLTKKASNICIKCCDI